MRRLVASVLSLGVLAGLVLVPALYYDFGTAAATYEETSITSYDAEFTVDADGVDRLHQTLNDARLHHDCQVRLLRGVAAPKMIYLTVRPVERIAPATPTRPLRG